MESRIPNPNNITHLSVMIQGELADNRPEVRLVPTSNPGTAADHFIGLVERIYVTSPNTPAPGWFAGYVTYRFCNVKFWKKTEYLPEFSSVEVRGPNFEELQGAKVHFLPKKVQTEDPQLYAEASQEAQAAGGNYDEELLYQIGRRCFRKAVKLIEDLVDNKLHP